MRNRTIVSFLILGALAAALSGCLIDDAFPAFPFLPGVIEVADGLLLELVSAAGIINRPQVGRADTFRVQPYTRVVILFETSRDGYGNPTGLSDDRVWSLTDVEVRCELKGVNDTIYTPGDPQHHDGISANGRANACYWFPLYTGALSQPTGLPYSPFPLAGYPFDACQDVGTTPYPEQEATLTARATAEHIRIRITVPEHEDGTYILDLPGAIPQASNVFELGVGSHGPITVTWEMDGRVEVYTVDVPVDWFWISGRWQIQVAGSSGC